MPACRRAAQQRDEFASSHVRPQVERPNLPHCRCEECLVRRADQCPLCEVERTLCGRRATSESDPGRVKTRKSREGAELFSLFSSFDGGWQSCSFLIQRNRDKLSTRKFDVGVFTQPGPNSDMG